MLVSFTAVATCGNLGAKSTKSATVTTMNSESLIDAHHNDPIGLAKDSWLSSQSDKRKLLEYW